MRILFLFSVFLISCSTKPCVQLAPPPQTTKTNTIKVFKYDGTQQCGMGREIPLENMEDDLKGIKVTNKFKKHDNLMRIQVCGAGTGKANVYEIPKESFAEAQKRGFKEWTY